MGNLRGPERDRLLAQVVDLSPNAVVVEDLDGRVLAWNATAELAYGWTADEALGRPVMNLLSAADDLEVARQRARGGEVVAQLESRQYRRDGTSFPAVVTVFPLRDVEGAVSGVATSAMDVAERQALAAELAASRLVLEEQNAALKRSNADLEQFAYVASHDLSEPLRVIAGYARLLERQYSDVLDERAQGYLDFLTEGTHRMHALIEDLLTFSRFLRPVPELVAVPLVEAAEAAVAALEAQIAETGARVEVDLALPVVLGEPRRLVSLVQNLVSNGIKFARPDVPPHVRVHSPGSGDDGRVILAVDDNGIGVQPRYRERVFLMFQRLHVREAYAGNGIGLAICQKIVEAGGGRIWLDESPLGGTRVAATFTPAPLTPDPAVIPATGEASGPSAEGEAQWRA